MLETVWPAPVRSPALDAFASQGIGHGFFTRQGGVSRGHFAGLNVGMGSEDDRAAVSENRRRVADWLNVGVDRLVTVHQVHSADVVHVTAPYGGDRPRADAMVTNRPGLALGVLTADCGPILMVDADAGVIAAAHAGWRGALAGIMENTIEAMERLGAERGRLAAVLGPSISQDNYEVGPEVRQSFVAADSGNERHFSPSGRTDHWLFDLRGYVLARLEEANVRAELAGGCTYAQEELYYSYRRATHRGEPDYGRQISAIVMERD